jgi:hypothetical protein
MADAKEREKVVGVEISRTATGFDVVQHVDSQDLGEAPKRSAVLQNAFQQLRKETSTQAQAENADAVIANAQAMKASAKSLPSE